MLLSFFIYTATALSLFLLARNVVNREQFLYQTTGNYISFFCLEIILSICLFALISGVRYKVGVDHLSYLDEYLKLQNYSVTRRSTFESGFLLISQLFAKAGIHFSLYFAFWAALQIGFVYYAFRNNKRLLPFIGLCVMLGSYYLNWMNGMRQCVVACAFLLMIELVEKKRFWHYVVAIMLASTIHKSAIILLPIYFLLDKEYDLSNRKLNIGILIFCVALGVTPTWLHLISSFEKVLFFIGYEGYADKIELMTSENLRDTAWGPGRISLFLIDIFIVWFYSKMKGFYTGDKRLGMCFLLFFIGTCSYNLFANTSHIFLRPVEYFTIFRLPLTAYLLYCFMSQAKSLLFYILLILSCSNIYISMLKTAMMPSLKTSEFIIYKFFWDYMINL